MERLQLRFSTEEARCVWVRGCRAIEPRLNPDARGSLPAPRRGRSGRRAPSPAPSASPGVVLTVPVAPFVRWVLSCAQTAALGPRAGRLRAAGPRQVGSRGRAVGSLPVYFPSTPAKPQEFRARRRSGGLFSPGILSNLASPCCGRQSQGQRGDNLSPRKSPLPALQSRGLVRGPGAGGFMVLCVFWRVLPIVPC